MSYTPKPDSNIGKIYALIPSNRQITKKQLLETLTKETDVPVDSLSVHTRFLNEKNVIKIDVVNGETVYTRSYPTDQKTITKQPENKRGDVMIAVLNYCKEKVGKRIKITDFEEAVGKDVSVAALLRRLKLGGYIQFIEDTRPYEYLVLPEIKTIDKIPTVNQLEKRDDLPSVINPQRQAAPVVDNNNISNMTVGEILQDYMRLKVENERLREGLQRMGMEFLQLGILEHD